MQSLIDYLTPVGFVSDLFALTILAGLLVGIWLATKSNTVLWIAAPLTVITLCFAIGAAVVADGESLGLAMRLIVGICLWAIMALLSALLSGNITGAIKAALEERKKSKPAQLTR